MAKPPPPHLQRTVVMGTVGRSGGAVLRELLGQVPPPPVTVLGTRPFRHLPRGLMQAVVEGSGWAACLRHIDAGDRVLIVFDTQRHERESVFWRLERAHLIDLASALHARGLQRLDVVFAPDQPASAAETVALKSLGYGIHVPGPGQRAVAKATGGATSAPARLGQWVIHILVDTMRQFSQSLIHGRRQQRERARTRQRERETGDRGD